MFSKAKKSVQSNNLQSRTRTSAKVVTRAVTENRWVHRNQLEIGMYVSELDKPWEQTSFLFQGFEINNYDTLLAVQDSCEYAYVQTVKDAHVSSSSVLRLVGATK